MISVVEVKISKNLGRWLLLDGRRRALIVLKLITTDVTQRRWRTALQCLCQDYYSTASVPPWFWSHTAKARTSLSLNHFCWEIHTKGVSVIGLGVCTEGVDLKVWSVLGGLKFWWRSVLWGVGA